MILNVTDSPKDELWVRTPRVDPETSYLLTTVWMLVLSWLSADFRGIQIKQTCEKQKMQKGGLRNGLIGPAIQEHEPMSDQNSINVMSLWLVFFHVTSSLVPILLFLGLMIHESAILHNPQAKCDPTLLCRDSRPRGFKYRKCLQDMLRLRFESVRGFCWPLITILLPLLADSGETLHKG